MIVQNVISNKLGLSPLITKQKNIAPAVGAALVSAAGSLFGGAVNSSNSWVKQQQQNRFNFETQKYFLNEQQKYNDKINQQNFEWQDESNVRARIEKAGYNPYLYNGQASAQSVASNSAGSPPSENMPSGYDNSLGQGIANMGNSFSQVLGAMQDYKNKNQEFTRNYLADAYMNQQTGGNGGVLGAMSLAQYKQANSVANMNDSVKFHQDMMNKLDQLQYTDVNGVPQTNPDGSPMTLAQANALGISRGSMKSVEKLVKEISVLASQGKSIDLDNKIKEYNLDNGYYSEALKILKMQFRQLQSQIFLNNSNAFLARMQALTQRFTQDNIYANTQYINTQNGHAQQRFLFDLSNLASQGDLLDRQSQGLKLDNMLKKHTYPSLSIMNPFNTYTNNFFTPQGLSSLAGIAGGFLNPMGFFMR
jgi:hypothetical protein|nr:MAG TPA: hypothetical protein [Microviridae sp.]